MSVYVRGLAVNTRRYTIKRYARTISYSKLRHIRVFSSYVYVRVHVRRFKMCLAVLQQCHANTVGKHCSADRVQGERPAIVVHPLNCVQSSATYSTANSAEL